MSLRHGRHGCHGRGHRKIFMFYIICVQYFANMVQWQSENKTTTQREQQDMFCRISSYSIQTHTAVV